MNIWEIYPLFVINLKQSIDLSYMHMEVYWTEKFKYVNILYFTTLFMTK